MHLFHKHAGRLILLTLLLTTPGMSKLFRVGLKAGAPVTDVVKSGYHAAGSNPLEADNFVIGPVVELQLPMGLGVEADALRRKIDSPAGAAWKFPVLAKYRFPGLGVRPYVAAGLSFNRNDLLRAFSVGPAETATGFAFGAGLELALPVIHLTPEVRFTRWRTGNFGTQQYDVVNRNQFEFLAGITF